MVARINVLVRAFGFRAVLAILSMGLVVAPLAWVANGSPRDDSVERNWNFESDRIGSLPVGFTQVVGRWEVFADGDNRVLAQTAESERRAFNLTLIEDTRYQNLDVTVRVKASAGAVDQGGGLIWRAQDRNNYYVARYNPLEDNVRVYKVEGGRRTQLDHADAKGDREWHTLRITMTGREIVGYLDGRRLLVAEDSTFREAGKIGLWTKADARSVFDDLSAREIPAKAP
jgi:hypothetical protein